MSFRNLIFSVLGCLLLVGPSALFCAQNVVKADLPSNVTAEDASYLTGGIVEVDVRASASIAGFASGEFQSAMEDEVGNYIPFKADALLGNAALQRLAIGSSNRLFSWPCYPTYFGSTKLYSPEHNALFEMPMLNESRIMQRRALEDDLESFGKGLALVASQFPEKRFIVIMADRSSTSSVNPANPLVTETMMTSECVQVLYDEVAGVENVSVDAREYDDIAEYLGRYYPTDHHWNGYGAIDAFYETQGRDFEESGALGDGKQGSVSFAPLVFNGTLSRRGLLCLNRSVTEPEFDTSDLEVDEAAAQYFSALLSEDGPALVNQQGLRAEYNFYSLWYGGDRACEIHNEAIETGSALLISDSYGDAFRWILAERYHRVIGKMDLKKAKYSVEELSEVVKASDCGDVYIVGWAGGFHALT